MKSIDSDKPLELCVVVPTFNEADNIARLIEQLSQTLEGIEWEAVVVDDESPDGTANVVREIALTDRRVRILKRLPTTRSRSSPRKAFSISGSKASSC